MTNAASYVLVSIGAVDVAWSVGLVRPTAVLAAWIAGWWLIRAAGQFALGRRRGDLAIAAWFGLLGVAHVLAAAA